MIKSATFTLLTILLVAMSSPAIHVQDAWQKKPYQEWSREEALKVITDSPWAQTTTFEFDSEFSRKPVEHPLVTVRLRSALPIRQSLVRLKQIKAKYDKLPAPEKTKLDSETKSLLECSLCTKYYVVSFELNYNFDRKPFEKLSDDDSKSNIYIVTDNGERRNLATIVIEGREIFLFFPRLDANGQNLVTLDTKAFQIVVDRKKLKQANLPILMPGGATFGVASLVKGNEILF